MTKTTRVLATLLLPLALAAFSTVASAQQGATYSQDSILDEAERFFGGPTEGLAKVVEKVFSDLGEPTAYIAGDELSGAFGIGARWGKGTLSVKGGGSTPVYWTGPSIGFDVGGNASRVFVLVYNLERPDDLFQRFPAIDGSFYFVAGVGANYHQSSSISLAPIRIGVGLRAGANIGWMSYTPKRSWLPF